MFRLARSSAALSFASACALVGLRGMHSHERSTGSRGRILPEFVLCLRRSDASSSGAANLNAVRARASIQPANRRGGRMRAASLFGYAAILLILCALALRASVPAGYMPVDDGKGGLAMAMCSGSAAISMNSSREGQQDPDLTPLETCAFAMVHAQASPTPPKFSAPIADRLVELDSRSLPLLAPITSQWSTAAPPTGPPSHA